MNSFIVCHYDEIGLKGRNRKFFEEKLAENIKVSAEKKIPGCFIYIKRMSGRIIGEIEEGKANKKALEDILKNIPGIANFSFAEEVKQNIEDIGKKSVEILEGKKFKTFRVSAQRANKSFLLTSQEINEGVGALIVEKLNKGVKLEEADLELFIEIVEKTAFIYTEKIKGVGGLPVSSGGKTVSMLSGGIDSPVASFFAMRRGSQTVFVHFHSVPQTSPASLEKVDEIAQVLSKFQPESKIYKVPFLDIQKQIYLKTPPKLRVVLYRRFMLRIAEEIAKKEGALAIVTGESLGQVASQTLENISAIQEAASIPIFRPLIGMDKKEIIKKAEEIGTYSISISAADDCCSLFIPKDPETKAKIEEVRATEKELEVEKLVQTAINSAESKII